MMHLDFLLTFKNNNIEQEVVLQRKVMTLSLVKSIYGRLDIRYLISTIYLPLLFTMPVW